MALRKGSLRVLPRDQILHARPQRRAGQHRNLRKILLPTEFVSPDTMAIEQLLVVRNVLVGVADDRSQPLILPGSHPRPIPPLTLLHQSTELREPSAVALSVEFGAEPREQEILGRDGARVVEAFEERIHARASAMTRW